MSFDEKFWDAPQLSPEDEAIVDAYRTIGRSLDDLPYTEDFDRLMDVLKRPREMDQMHFVFRRLMTLRKRGQLPRIGAGSAA
jgi:hypothetical protein